MEAKETVVNEGLQLVPWVDKNNARFKTENAMKRTAQRRKLWKRRAISYLTFGGWCALAATMFIFGSLYIRGGF